MGPLASYQDANGHLDEVKISFVDQADATKEADEAYKTIAAKIGGLWPEHIELWDITPDLLAGEEEPPQVVNLIASLLMASYRYAKRYSEEELGESDFSARLEKRALGLLDGLVDGSVILWDKDYATGNDANAPVSADVWPNDSYTKAHVAFEKENALIAPELQEQRAFSMDMDL